MPRDLPYGGRPGAPGTVVLLAAGGLAVALLAAGPLTAAGAEPPAGEAYLLDLPEVGATEIGGEREAGEAPEIAGASGVVGGREEPAGRLASIGSALAGPAGVALLVPLAVGAGLLLGSARGPRREQP